MPLAAGEHLFVTKSTQYVLVGALTVYNPAIITVPVIAHNVDTTLDFASTTESNTRASFRDYSFTLDTLLGSTRFRVEADQESGRLPRITAMCSGICPVSWLSAPVGPFTKRQDSVLKSDPEELGAEDTIGSMASFRMGRENSLDEKPSFACKNELIDSSEGSKIPVFLQYAFVIEVEIYS